MLALSAGTDPANGLLEGAVVILASGAITGVATYVWLVRRFDHTRSASPKKSAVNSTDHLDEVMTDRAASVGLRLPVELRVMESFSLDS